MAYRCCVKGCDNTNDYYPSRGKYYDGKFIKFPDNPQRREKWNSALNLTGKTKRYVCSEHFPADAWRVQDVIMKVPLAKRKLKLDAVPTLDDELLREVENESDEMHVEKRERLIKESLTAYENKLEQGAIDANKPNSCRGGTPKYKTENKNEPEEDTTTDYKWEEEMLIEECEIRLIQTRKCGEITVDIDEHTFALNCFLCTDVCLDLEEFICHIKEQHAKFLNPKTEMEMEHLTSDITNIIVTEAAPLQQNLKNSYVDDIDDVDVDNNDTDDHEGDVKNEDEYSGEGDEDDDHSITECNKNSDDDDDDDHTTTECNKNSDDDLATKSGIAIDLSNELFITATIEQLEQHPVLWDVSNPFRKRKDATIAILHALNSAFPNIALTYKTVSNVLLKLCQAHRYDRRHMEMSKQRNYIYVPKYWFFHRLQFLGSGDPTEEKVKYGQRKFKPILDMIGTEKEDPLMDLIKMYEQLPSLWNINDEQYRGKFKNSDRMLELFEWIQEENNAGLEIRTRALLIKLLNLLNRWFSAEEQTRLKTIWSNSSSYESRFPRLYMSLEFLRGHVAPFQCEICRQTCATEETYRKHTKSRAGGIGCAGRQENVHECEYCGKRLQNPHNLRTHIRQHTKERPYKCELCDSSFSDYSTFYRHGRIHTKLKPFKCNECKSSYYTNYLLLEHQKSHLGIRDVVCDICGKAFTDVKNLYSHRRKVHLKKPPLNARDKVCNVCGKAFTGTKYLRQHKQIHAKKKAYACNICNKEFAQYAGLHGHMKSHKSYDGKLETTVDGDI